MKHNPIFDRLEDAICRKFPFAKEGPSLIDPNRYKQVEAFAYAFLLQEKWQLNADRRNSKVSKILDCLRKKRLPGIPRCRKKHARKPNQKKPESLKEEQGTLDFAKTNNGLEERVRKLERLVYLFGSYFIGACREIVALDDLADEEKREPQEGGAQ